MIVLKRIWNAWLKFGRMLGDLIGRLLLTVFYFTFFLPFGLLTRLFGDPLAIRSRSKPYWLVRTTRDRSLPDTHRMF